jgi:hypothetical protein
MLDNIDVAIFTKLNELAERRGLRPYDFVATYSWDGKEESWVLRFEVPASGNALREERFDKMLSDLGIAVTDRAELRGEPGNIVDALDRALNLSPRKPGPRF